jgi:hypothetical protein
MFIYFLAALAIALSRFLWNNRYWFNNDHSKNFSDTKVPMVKNGFYFALLGAGEGIE